MMKFRAVCHLYAQFSTFSFSLLALDIPVARRLVYELTRSVLPRRLHVEPAVVFSGSSVSVYLHHQD
jgi:hypothetical protein